MHPTDPAASLETLLAERAWLQALARRLVADESTADDLEQETWLAALSHSPTKPGAARAWLAVVLRNVLRDRRRAERRRTRREEVVARPEAFDTDDVVARADVHLRLAQAVFALEEPYRTTVLLRFFDGLNVAEAAGRLGVSQDVVRKRITRAVAQLRARLDDRYGDRDAWAVLFFLPGGAARSVTTTTLGGLLMAKKLAIAVAVLLLLLGGWQVLRVRDRGRTDSNAVETAAAPHSAALPGRHAKPDAEIAETPASTPPVEEIRGPKATGRVVDADGRAVAGARVVSLPDDIRETIEPDKAGVPGGRTFRATTDADGRFVVRLDDKAPAATLYADASGLSAASLLDVRAGDDVVIHLDRPGVLAGTVMDIDGTPIAGATVRVLDLVDAVQLAHAATSDEKGAYRVEGLPRKSARYVEVIAGGFARLLIEEYPSNERRDLVLVRGATLIGHVVDAETGAPIEGARVVVWSTEGYRSFDRVPGGGWSNPWAQQVLGETLTVSDGGWSFEHVPAQGFHPSASHNAARAGGTTMGNVVAWRDGWSLHVEEVPLAKDGGTITVDLKLWPSATVEGLAVRPDGSTVADASVIAEVGGRDEGAYVPPVVAERGTPRAWTRSGADGRFRLDGVRAAKGGATQVKVRGYLPEIVRASSDPDGEATVEVRPGDHVGPVTLTLSSRDVPEIVVRVRDGNGKPVWGATLQVLGWRTWRTDANGLARMDFAYPGNPGAQQFERSIVVRAKGFAAATLSATPARGGPEIPVTLDGGNRVAGRVRWADGSPAAGALVQVANAAVPIDEIWSDSDRPRVPTSPRPGLVLYGSTNVAPDGTFELVDLPGGPYHVAAITVSARGAIVRDVRQDVAAGAGDLVFVLPKRETPPTQAVEGAIRDAATGRAIVRPEVTLIGPAGAQTGKMTAPGRFTFAAVPAGTWTLRATAPGYAPFELVGLEIVAGAAVPALDVALDHGATVKGHVHAVVGALPDGGTIWFRSVSTVGASGFSTTVPLGRDGSFDVSGFPPGEYSTSVYFGNPGQAPPPLVISDGKPVVIADAHGTVAVDLGVVASGILSVTPSDPRLPPIPGIGRPTTDEQRAFGAAATLEVRDAAGALVASQKGLAENYPGMAGNLSVLPGAYVVRLLLPGDPPREERVSVTAGETARVSLKPR